MADEVQMNLIQRLQTPFKRSPANELLAKAHRVFGGGMHGLTDQAWDFLEEAFILDYMGASEYEMGSFQRSMQRIIVEASSKALKAFSFTVERHDVAPSPSRKFRPKKKKDGFPDPPTDDVTVYVICRKSQAVEVEVVIRNILKDQHQTRDDTMIHRTLDPTSQFDGKIVGWMSIDDDVFFFVDETMWTVVKGWLDL